MDDVDRLANAPPGSPIRLLCEIAREHRSAVAAGNVAGAVHLREVAAALALEVPADQSDLAARLTTEIVPRSTWWGS